MALISKPKKTTPKNIRVTLTSETFNELQTYRHFLEADQNHIINEALSFVFKRDKDYKEWKKANAETLADWNAVE